MVKFQDARPASCRFRLRGEGRAYPKSGCGGCGRSVTTGLGSHCTFADVVEETSFAALVERVAKSAEIGEFVAVLKSDVAALVEAAKTGQGYSADDIALQVDKGALEQLWKELGVVNQTQAVSRIHHLRRIESRVLDLINMFAEAAT